MGMSPSEYQSLLRHMEWADALTWQAALAVPALRQDRALSERFLHFHATQHAYLQIWNGEEVRIPEPSARITRSSAFIKNVW